MIDDRELSEARLSLFRCVAARLHTAMYEGGISEEMLVNFSGVPRERVRAILLAECVDAGVHEVASLANVCGRRAKLELLPIPIETEPSYD